MKLRLILFTCLVLGACISDANAQITERPRPEEWKNLVYGGRFMDRFLPMPDQGRLTRDTWGGENVIPRLIDNGIEDRNWSYWGGNIIRGEDGKYHLLQYNLIVNDWLGRIAFYERSKDGLNWKVESGEAYLPGVAKHEDGTFENWFKYERIKVFQDQYGRATQANFAVIDTLKKHDQANDIHSSKNIVIPLIPGRLITLLNTEKITSDTKTIRIKIAAEDDFNPHTDIDINTLVFGDPEEVNYGRGSRVLSTEKSGKDLIITFNGNGKGFPEDEFAAKLLGRTSTGNLLFGYARLPWVNFIEPILSACLPVFTSDGNGFRLQVEVQNFGQVASKIAKLEIIMTGDAGEVKVATGKIPALNPFEKTTVELRCGNIFDQGVEYNLAVIINPDDKMPATLHGKVVPVR